METDRTHTTTVANHNRRRRQRRERTQSAAGVGAKARLPTWERAPRRVDSLRVEQQAACWSSDWQEGQPPAPKSSLAESMAQPAVGTRQQRVRADIIGHARINM